MDKTHNLSLAVYDYERKAETALNLRVKVATELAEEFLGIHGSKLQCMLSIIRCCKMWGRMACRQNKFDHTKVRSIDQMLLVTVNLVLAQPFNSTVNTVILPTFA
jgi:hypothetical protein